MQLHHPFVLCLVGDEDGWLTIADEKGIKYKFHFGKIENYFSQLYFSALDIAAKLFPSSIHER